MRDYLIVASYATQCLDNCLEVAPAVRTGVPRLILLDLIVPGCDGLQVCEELRSFSSVPIIMIIARVKEVVARVKDILRQSPHLLTSAATRLRIDDEQYQAFLVGIPLDPTHLELRLLSALARSTGRIFSRDQLLDRIYSDHRVVTDRTFDSHNRNLRRKFEQALPGEHPIESLYGVGKRYLLLKRQAVRSAQLKGCLFHNHRELAAVSRRRSG
jgi:two-component system response regulator BaeR